ncbi:unnamed protein product [Schistosoma mattheei]|uniref:Uncharacterized protein n=1 Tax=Schistosoma mattheei TaxID=31246 RepID=A0A183PPF4_9TREM|nr:unnamed protein product [Schistosoma mattheei]
MLLYSSHEEENAPHTQGVVLMTSKEARKALIGWESQGPRIIKASFKTRKQGITMNVIQCYAPNNDSNDDDKDQFYETAFGHTEVPRKGPNHSGGRLNAKFEMDNIEYEDVMGRHGD